MTTQNETGINPPESTSRCKNCELEFSSEFRYCPRCGQKKISKLTLSELFNNFISNYLAVDGRFLKSIGPLMVRPGFLSTQFVLGKRETYLHPVRMYMFISIVFFFVFSFFIRDSETKIHFGDNEIASQLESDTSIHLDELGDSLDLEPRVIGLIQNSVRVDSLIQAGADDKEIYEAMGMKEDAGFFTRKVYKQLLKLYKEGGAREVYQQFFDSIPVAMFFLLPVFALILFLFHSRRGSYAHHLVFSYYYFSFVFVILGILYSAYWWFNGLPSILDWLLGLAPVIYLAIGMKRFYDQPWKWTILKELGILFIFMLIFVPITVGLVGLYAFLYF